MLVCKECGNKDKFTQTARVSEVWLCDNSGMMTDVLETYDAEEKQDFRCFSCDSYQVEEVIEPAVAI